jgi:hypothetical protein
VSARVDSIDINLWIFFAAEFSDHGDKCWDSIDIAFTEIFLSQPMAGYALHLEYFNELIAIVRLLSRFE